MTINDYYNQLKKLLDRETDKNLSQYEKELIKVYKEALRKIKNQLAELYMKFEKPTYAEAVKYNRLNNVFTSIAEELKTLSPKLNKDLEKLIKEVYEQNYAYNTYSISSAAQIDISYSGLSIEKLNAAIFNEYNLIKWTETNQAIVNQMMSNVKQSIIRGLLDGSPLYQVSKNIQATTEKTAYQSLRVARTETLRASNVANNISNKDAQKKINKIGITSKKVWQATLDKRTRRDHAILHNTEADSEGMFDVGGTMAECPHDAVLPPNEVINCRCTTTLRFEGFTGQAEKNAISYPEWYKKSVGKYPKWFNTTK